MLCWIDDALLNGPDVDADVVVVGAGLAGLRCAGALTARGFSVVVLEQGDRPGGRVRTDVVDGLRCDRGFQLLNPSYPAVRRHVDVGDLDLQVAGRGVRVVDSSGRPHTLADPVRHLDQLPATLRATASLRLLRARPVAGVVRWAASAVGPVSRLKAAPDASLAQDWARLGVGGALRDAVLAPFLAGVLGDSAGTTSDRYVRLVLRSFLLATPGVPAAGMQALPDQLARRSGADLRYRRRVVGIDDGPTVTVHVADDDPVRARAVVLAADPVGAARLTGRGAPVMRGLSTWWFASDEPVGTAGGRPDRFLRVSGSGGPVVNTAVMSAIAPGYAPPGITLVQGTTLLDGAGPVGEDVIRGELARLWGRDTQRWRLVIRHDVPHALPDHPAGQALARPQLAGERLVLAGDHLDTPSIQGALVSGGRAAATVARILDAPSG